MREKAKIFEFEEAQKIKEKIEVLENYQSRSTVLNPKITNLDVFSIISDETMAYVNFLQISHGAIVRSHTLELKKKLDEQPNKHLLPEYPIKIYKGMGDEKLRVKSPPRAKKIVLDVKQKH